MSEGLKRGHPSAGLSRRVLRWLFPWFVIGRVQLLAEGPWLYPDTEPIDDWEHGYRRAMEEVLGNLGLDPYEAKQ